MVSELPQQIETNKPQTDASNCSKEGSSSKWHIIGATANLLSTTIGPTILSLPFAFYQSGLIFGSALLLFTAVTNVVSTDLIVQTIDKYQVHNYEKLVEVVFGRRAKIFTESSLLFLAMGTCVAYILAVGDILSLLVGEDKKLVAKVIVWSVTMVPLSLVRKTESLQWTSILGNVGILILFYVQVHHAIAFNPEPSNLRNVLWPENGVVSVLLACPIILFAFFTQDIVGPIYKELPEKDAMRCVTRNGVSLCLFIYLGTSVVCLYEFGSAVDPNILMNYNRMDSVIVPIAFVATIIATTAAFPFNVFLAREIIKGIWANKASESCPGATEDDDDIEAQDSKSIEIDDQTIASSTETDEASHSDEWSESTWQESSLLSNIGHVALSLAIAGFGLVFAIIIPDITTVFGILGGTTTTLLGFILPGLFGIHLGSRRIGWFMVVCGSVIGIVTTSITLIMAFKQ